MRAFAVFFLWCVLVMLHVGLTTHNALSTNCHRFGVLNECRKNMCWQCVAFAKGLCGASRAAAAARRGFRFCGPARAKLHDWLANGIDKRTSRQHIISTKIRQRRLTNVCAACAPHYEAAANANNVLLLLLLLLGAYHIIQLIHTVMPLKRRVM